MEINLVINVIRTGLVVLGGLALIRAFIGPLIADRIIAVNYIVTQVVLVILLGATFEEMSIYLDVALVFVLGAFISTLGVLKLMEEGRI